MISWVFNLIEHIKGNNGKPTEGTVPNYGKLVIAALSGVATGFLLQPMDFIKIRMQMNGKGGVQRDHANSLQAIKHIVQREGVLAFYSGTCANLVRQTVYITAKFGFYEYFVLLLDKRHYAEGFHTPGLLFGSFIGAFALMPIDVAVVRIMADGRLPLKKRRNYKNIFNALYRIGREEGMIGLWAGTIPTLVKVVSACVVQILTYKEFKHFLDYIGYIEDDITCHYVCACSSAIVCSAVTSPFDIFKTRIQAMKTENGIPEYKGLIDVMEKTVEKEGVTALWKGFGLLTIRSTHATMLLFIISQKLNSLFKQHVFN